MKKEKFEETRRRRIKNVAWNSGAKTFYIGHDPWPMQTIESTGISVALENDTVVQFALLWKADLQPSLYGVTCKLQEIATMMFHLNDPVRPGV